MPHSSMVEAFVTTTIASVFFFWIKEEAGIRKMYQFSGSVFHGGLWLGFPSPGLRAMESRGALFRVW